MVGLSEENDFTRQMYADMHALREAERAAARQGNRGMILLDSYHITPE